MPAITYYLRLKVGNNIENLTNKAKKLYKKLFTAKGKNIFNLPIIKLIISGIKKIYSYITFKITYSTIELPNPSNCLKKLGSTNSCYASSISSLSNKKPVYVVLTSDLKDISVSFLHV